MKNSKDNIFSEFSSILKSQKIESIDEANLLLAKLAAKQNSLGRSEFLGLSPNQMNLILYNNFENGKFLTLNRASHDFLSEIPIVQQAVFILNKIAQAKELKLTEKGSLPRALVQEFWAEFVNDDFHFKPSRESECLEATRLRSVLEGSGLLKVRNKKLTLTKKSEAILEARDLNTLYLKIFESFLNIWNWACMDRFPDFDIVQTAGLYSFFMLREKFNEISSITEIGSEFIRAFPRAFEEEGFVLFDSPEESFLRCYDVRFLNRVCVPLGILTRVGKHNPFSRGLKSRYQVTPFFKEAFLFNEEIGS